MIANIAFKFEKRPELTRGLDYPNVEYAVAYDTTTGVRYGIAQYAISLKTVMLLSIYVDPTARRQGIANSLVRAVDARHPNMQLKAKVNEYDSETLASVIKLGFNIYSRYMGIIAEDAAKYPPLAPSGWILDYERNRSKQDFSKRHQSLHEYLHSGFEDDIL